MFEKVYKTFDHFPPVLSDIFGTPERGGFWIIYGKEKNGKTWVSLMLANLLSQAVTVGYISAEEGMSMNFRDTMDRLGISHKNRKLKLYEYLSLDEIKALLGRSRGKPHVLFIDNTTIYADEIRVPTVRDLQREYPNTLIVFVAHEERNEPWGAHSRMVKKLAKVIIRIEGLRAFVGGRVPGGEFDIDDEAAQLYFGHKMQES